MPAFTFEKISSPIQHVPNQHVTPAHIKPAEAPKPNKPRGMIVRILDRFVASRVKRSLREEKAVMPAAEGKHG